MVLIRAVVQDFVFGERSTFYSTFYSTQLKLKVEYLCTRSQECFYTKNISVLGTEVNATTSLRLKIHVPRLDSQAILLVLVHSSVW